MGIITNVDIDLEHTFESGQLFRYFERDGVWYVQNGDKALTFQVIDGDLHYTGASEQFVRHFLGLDDDVAHIFSKYQDPVLQRAFEQFAGIRLTRQDPWECTISFLCSSNANIPKIKKNIAYMCEQKGSTCECNGEQYYTFPKQGTLSDEQMLRDAKTGYRAKYIVGTNNLLTPQLMQQIFDAPYEEAKQLLIQMPGIGEKVADCILLFGFDKKEAFPVDTWIHKIMCAEYFNGENVPVKKVAQFARDRFGKDAGYVQQYLFYLARKEY